MDFKKERIFLIYQTERNIQDSPFLEGFFPLSNLFINATIQKQIYEYK